MCSHCAEHEIGFSKASAGGRERRQGWPRQAASDDTLGSAPRAVDCASKGLKDAQSKDVTSSVPPGTQGPSKLGRPVLSPQCHSLEEMVQ